MWLRQEGPEMFDLFPLLKRFPAASGFVIGAVFTLALGLFGGVVYSGTGVGVDPRPVPQVYFF